MSKILQKELEIQRQKAVILEFENQNLEQKILQIDNRFQSLTIEFQEQEQILLQKNEVIQQKEEVIQQKEKVLLQKNEVILQKEKALLQKDEIIQQKESIVTKLKNKVEEISTEYSSLIQAFLDAQRQLFGRKSERFVDDTSEQLPLFAIDTNIEQNQTKPEDIEKISYTRRKKKSEKTDLSLIPQREVIIEVPAEERTCACGCTKELIRYDIKHILNYQPAIFEMIVQKREVLACKKGCRENIVTAPLPIHILPKCRASESLLSYIAVSKVLDRQPLYHLEQKIMREHFWHIPRQTMARWLIQLSEKLQPLINLMKEEIINYDIAAIDATTLQVLNEPHRLPQTKSYAYCVRGGPPKKEVILYEYNGDYHPRVYTHKQFVADLLAGFKGILHCDAADTTELIEKQEGVSLSYCHAHARRKFEAIEIARKKNKNIKYKPGLAHYVLTQIYQPLYGIEQEIKKQKMLPAQIKEYRQIHSKPILDAWLPWLQEHKEQTLKESPIGKAINYVLNHWDGLQTYLTDGRAEIDNNATERDIKPFVIARKNFLFACTQAGADALGVHFSLILTAKAHGLDPMTYYTNILQQIPLCKNFADYEKLLPWNYKNT